MHNKYMKNAYLCSALTVTSRGLDFNLVYIECWDNMDNMASCNIILMSAVAIATTIRYKESSHWLEFLPLGGAVLI